MFREKHVRVSEKRRTCFFEGKINKKTSVPKRMIALRKHCLFYGIKSGCFI